jgi:hypothetical protein
VKAHAFLGSIDWAAALAKKLPVPRPALKKQKKEDITLDKVFGLHAFDQAQKNVNRLNEWSFIEHQ